MSCSWTPYSVDGSVSGLELKAELALEGSAEGRGGVTDIWVGRPVAVKGEVVEADEAMGYAWQLSGGDQGGVYVVASIRETGVNSMKRTILLGSLFMAMAVLAGCDSKPAATAPPPPPPVTVARPLQKTITEWDEYTGRFTAVETVEVRARVSGFIDSIHFKEGQIVKQGDLLFVIDQRPYQHRGRPGQGRCGTRARPSSKSPRSTCNAATPLLRNQTITEREFDTRKSPQRDAAGQVASAEAAAQAGRAQSRMDRGARADLRAASPIGASTPAT